MPLARWRCLLNVYLSQSSTVQYGKNISLCDTMVDGQGNLNLNGLASQKQSNYPQPNPTRSTIFQMRPSTWCSFIHFSFLRPGWPYTHLQRKWSDMTWFSLMSCKYTSTVPSMELLIIAGTCWEVVCYYCIVLLACQLASGGHDWQLSGCRLRKQSFPHGE